MTRAATDERGVISGFLNLARNVGLVTGASVMGTVFATAIGGELDAATPAMVERAMPLTFAGGVLLLIVALAVARTSGTRTECACSAPAR